MLVKHHYFPGFMSQFQSSSKHQSDRYLCNAKFGREKGQFSLKPNNVLLWRMMLSKNVNIMSFWLRQA